MNEEKKAKNVRSIIEGKLDAYGVGKKSLYAIAGVIGCFILTIVMSITGTNFDPAIFHTWNYWVSLLIQYAIAIFSMITGRQIGDDTQRNRPDGQFRRELGLYKKEYDGIVDDGIFEYFEAWLIDYRERKRKSKIAEYLREWHIAQPAVLDLDITEISKLSEPYKKDWTGTEFYEKYYDKKKGVSETYFKSLTEEQIELLRQIMSGAVQVPYIDPSYFMNALKGTSVDEWNRAASSEKKKGMKVLTGYTYRLAMMLAVSMALNGLVAAPYEDNAAATIALTIATRVFVLVSSTVWGIFMGFKLVEMDIVYLAYKSLIIKTYHHEYKNGTFRHETVDEQAKREYEETEKKKVDVEVIDPNTPTSTSLAVVQ